MSKNLADASNEWKALAKNLADLDFSIVKALRDGQDDDAIAAYLRDWKQLPPIDVFFDGKTYWVVDGGHRGSAGELGGKKTIRCRIKRGTKREAELEAMGRNERHGVRRSSEEKRKIVEKLLDDPEWGKRSQRWIAERAQVDPKTVRNIIDARAEATEDVLSKAEPATGKDGRQFPARQPIPKPTGKRKKSGAKLSQEPQARGPQYDADGNEISSGEDLPAYCKRCGGVETAGHDCEVDPEASELAAALEAESAQAEATGARVRSFAGWVCPKEACGAPNEPWATICRWCDAPRPEPEPAPPPLPGKPPPAPPTDSKPIRVPTRVDLTEVELAALHCVTEADAGLHAELFDDWEKTEGHGESPEEDARGAVVKLGVRFE